MFQSPRLWAALASLLALGPAADVDAATLELDLSRPDCGGYTSGVGTCDVGLPTGSIDVTWQLQSAENLTGYELVVHWDPNEVTLTAATQLHPDTGSALPWDGEPNAPGDSAVVLSISPAATTALFRLTFSLSSPVEDGQSDVWWTAAGNGLSPGSVVLTNPSGSGVDLLVPPPVVSTLSRLAVLGLALLLALCATLLARRTRHAPN